MIDAVQHSLTSPLYSHRSTASTSGANGHIRSKRVGSKATAANQMATHHQHNGLIQAIQGGKVGSVHMRKSLRTSKPKDQILRIRPASIKPCPQGGTVGTRLQVVEAPRLAVALRTND